MKNQSQAIIDKIKKEHIVPQSHFLLNWKSYLFWMIWIFTVALGALFFSFIIINSLDVQPDIFRYLGIGRFFFILMETAPYLWIGLSLLALISGFLAIRKTKRGYRYSFLFVTFIGVLAISIIGATLHKTKVDSTVSHGIMKKAPNQKQIMFPVQDRWSNPDSKLLGGEIVEMRPDNFMLINFRDEIWQVEYSPQTKMMLPEKMEVGMRVGVLGAIIGNQKFKADAIQLLPPAAFPQRDNPPPL